MALCGPPSALSSLQKHTTADRSHQQERFQSRPGLASQTFRSGQSSAWGDNEFDTFTSTGAAPLNTDPFFAQQQPQYQQQQASWAADFQRLDIGSPLQQFPAPAFAQQSQPQWGWEFAQRLQQREAPLDQESLSRATALGSNYMGLTSTFSPSSSSSSSLDLGVSQQQQQQPTAQQNGFRFDTSTFESAFEKAFADAEREVELVAGPEPFPAEPEPEAPRLDKGKEKEQLQRESDDLARTAGQLLDSVQENMSAKFQNSNFLALMRRLRDHEIVVEGNEIVEARS